MKTIAIIVNYNDRETIYRKVKSTAACSAIDAVIVVDNKSTDDSAQLVRNIDKVTVLYGEKNGGYGYGNNIGLRYAAEILHADYAIISNPDTEISDDSINAMINLLSSDAAVAVCAPICRTPESSYEAPVSAWPFRPWHLELFEHCPLLRRLFRRQIHYPSDFFRGNIPVEVFAVLGSCLAVDIKKVLESGAYDDDVFLYCEENILGYKLKKHGYKTMLLCNHSYLHNHKPGVPDVRKIHILRDSELIYFNRYLSISSFKQLVTRILFAIVSLETRLFCR